MAKNLVLGPIFAHLVQIWALFFLSKIWLRQYQILQTAIIMYNIKKTNYAIFRKVSGRRTERNINTVKVTSMLKNFSHQKTVRGRATR